MSKITTYAALVALIIAAVLIYIPVFITLLIGYYLFTVYEIIAEAYRAYNSPKEKRDRFDNYIQGGRG